MEKIEFYKSGHIATLTINRPAKLNAVDVEMARAIVDTARIVNDDDEVRVLVVRGAGDRAFCVGSDIAALADYSTPWEYRKRVTRGADWGIIGPGLRVPVIAMIQGYCLGGGFELALNCDLRIASTDAMFGAPEVNLGWIGGGAASQLLPRLVGYGRAFELLTLGHRIDAAEAHQWGMVNRVVSADELESTTYTVAEQLAQKAPIAVQVIKEAIRYSMNTALDVGRRVENELVWGTFSTEDKLEGERAFLEKRSPEFRGR